MNYPPQWHLHAVIYELSIITIFAIVINIFTEKPILLLFPNTRHFHNIHEH